jgi:hypothetical protein
MRRTQCVARGNGPPAGLCQSGQWPRPRPPAQRRWPCKNDVVGNSRQGAQLGREGVHHLAEQALEAEAALLVAEHFPGRVQSQDRGVIATGIGVVLFDKAAVGGDMGLTLRNPQRQQKTPDGAGVGRGRPGTCGRRWLIEESPGQATV